MDANDFLAAETAKAPVSGPVPPGRSRETDIRRDAAGRWWKGEDQVEHPNLTRSFDGWIDRADDGRYCLSNDINWGYIQLEGPAYRVLSVGVEDGAVTLRLSGDREEPLMPDTLRQDTQGALWCDVRAGRCPARFENHATAALADCIGEDEQGVFLTLGGQVYRPQVVQDGALPE